MRWKKNGYWFHRWIALIVSFQLLAWSISGLVFTLLDIDNVHGDWERIITPPSAIKWGAVSLTPHDAVAAAQRAGVNCDAIARVKVHEYQDRPRYVLFDDSNKPRATVDAASGAVQTRITEEQAKEIARADFKPDADIATVRFLEGDAPLEFRGGPMPVYQVTMDHPKKTHLYISPVTGQVITRRNQPWRWFDFLWMLHIMDYSERDNFNHPLLTGMSVLAILTSASGLLLWWWRRPWRRSRRTPDQAASFRISDTG